MLKHIRETEILKRYSKPPGDPPDDTGHDQTGTISTFPSSPLDMPTATFERDLKRRQQNHRKLIKWIQKNLHPDIHYGRVHTVRAMPVCQGRSTAHVPRLQSFQCAYAMESRGRDDPWGIGTVSPFPESKALRTGRSP